jgi:hypothetical protein
MKDYYRDQFRLLAELKDQLISKKISFFRQFLVLSTSMLGILVSFHPTLSANLYIRLVFVLGVLLLLFGILTIAKVVHDYTALTDQKVKAFYVELQTALQEERQLEDVFGGHLKKMTRWCEKYSLPILFMSLVMLSVYTVLINFF